MLFRLANLISVWPHLKDLEHTPSNFFFVEIAWEFCMKHLFYGIFSAFLVNHEVLSPFPTFTVNMLLAWMTDYVGTEEKYSWKRRRNRHRSDLSFLSAISILGKYFAVWAYLRSKKHLADVQQLLKRFMVLHNYAVEILVLCANSFCFLEPFSIFCFEFLAGVFAGVYLLFCNIF